MRRYRGGIELKGLYEGAFGDKRRTGVDLGMIKKILVRFV